MDDREARQYLDQFPRFEVKPGLSRIQQLLEAAGKPHLAYPTVHVGGTNGKGSVAAMVDAVLRHAGLRVGRFTSPELMDFRDRIAVNGEWITEDELARAVTRLAPAIEALDDVPSQFEVITALAFHHFADVDVDMGVIEVGLGGRYDATNVVRPDVAILTNVSLDHTALLGGTVEKIAWEKAGIAKSAIPLLVGPLQDSVRRIVQRECEKTGAAVVAPLDIQLQRVSRDWRHATYHVDGFGQIDQLTLPLIATHQIENLRLALGTVRELRQRGSAVPDDAIREGLRSVSWPGRLEMIREDPMIIVDGAHNPSAMQDLADDVRDLVPDSNRRYLLYGTLADKDVEAVLRILSATFPRIGLCASRSARALPIEALLVKAHERFTQLTRDDSVVEGAESWLWSASQVDVLVVTGSLTVVAEARRYVMEGL